MNGVHDVGGMQDFGPIRPEANEPVFHAPWEGRVLAMNLAMAAWGKFVTDNRRYARELIPPAEQLAMSYYEKWYAGLVMNMVDAGMVTRDEVASGTAAPGSPKATPPLAAARVPVFWSNGSPKIRHAPATANFQLGQRVRARNINPVTHTRLPRYARGKSGVVDKTHGIFVFPDSNAQGLGEKPQYLYSVRFAARELWGEQARAKDSVYIDMWDDYLEAALESETERLGALPSLPRDAGGPVFAEPWQAQAFALAVELSAQGHFTWKEWAAALADELRAAADRGEPDDGSHYYEHWLAALERLTTEKSLANRAEMLARKEAWADVYRHTPHGKPVELPGDTDHG